MLQLTGIQFIMEVKKSGIRLRHLQQQQKLPLTQKRRDISPNTANRKKIFQKLPQHKNNERQQHDKKINTPIKLTEHTDKVEHQKLVQNLRRKSMQVQVRDNLIKNLNREIDQLKKQVQIKDKQIAQLKKQLQMATKITKETQQENIFFESFKDSEIFSKKKSEEQYSWNKHSQPNQMINKPLPTNEEISMMNLQMGLTPSFQPQTQQPEILSPFMVFNKKADTDTLINQLPTQSAQRQHTQTFHGYSGNMTGNSFQNPNTSKGNLLNPFENFAPKKYTTNANNNTFNASFNKNPCQVQYPRQYPRKSVEVSRNIDRFNICAESDTKSQVRQVTKLEIDDSRSFKFQDFGTDQSQF